MRYFALLPLLAILCGCGEKPATLDDLNTRDVTLPGGQILRVETMMDATDMMRGLMFRTSLAPDRGMLFIYRSPTRGATFWMYQTLIPLDIVWLDSSKRVVEIVANAAPCKTEASKCPSYGGTQLAQYVLEIGGGMAQKYGIHVGDSISF